MFQLKWSDPPFWKLFSDHYLWAVRYLECLTLLKTWRQCYFSIFYVELYIIEKCREPHLFDTSFPGDFYFVFCSLPATVGTGYTARVPNRQVFGAPRFCSIKISNWRGCETERVSSHNSSCAYIVQFRAIHARTPISRIVPIAEHSMSSEYLTSNGIRYTPAGVPLFHVGI